MRCVETENGAFASRVVRGALGRLWQPGRGTHNRPDHIGGRTVQIALPRLVIDVDAEATQAFSVSRPRYSVHSESTSPGFRLPETLVDQFVDAGVQHLEVAIRRRPFDALCRWQAASPFGLESRIAPRLLDTMQTLEVQNVEALRICPSSARLGLDVVLRFPRDPNTAEIPLSTPAPYAFSANGYH
jgi:hypothetical protein